MATQGEQGKPKRPKLLACARCRHRKQKCTEVRPCENCTQSGSECVPYRSTTSKSPLEPEYVRRLEERIAQLESLIPQESLDHIDGVQSQERPRPTSARGAEVQSSPDVVYDYQDYPNQLDSPQNEGANFAAPMPLAYTPPDNMGPDFFGVLSGLSNQALPIRQDQLLVEPLDVDLETERFLFQTYFDMAHSQYPFLLKHQFLEWAQSWREMRHAVPNSMRWKGFMVYMVYAIGFRMTKIRINGPTRSQALYALATSKYLPYLVASSSPLVRAQGFLLLTIYALHMPSQENIIALSSWTIRFCVMSQLHLVETEPQPINSDTLIKIQHRRRIFWCAYGVDRAVCSSYDFPCSIQDEHITVPIFENIDDDQLLSTASSVQPGSQLLGYDSPTNLSTALHVLESRQLESEIQEMVLSKNFVAHSDESFIWRAAMLDKLKEWNRRSDASSDPSRKGYVSLGWLKMIHYYNIVMLYRPTRTIAQGTAGDWSVQACCQALLMFRKFQMAKEISQPWLGLLTQFQIGVTLLYCFYATPTSRWRPSYKSADVSDAIRACSSTLAILAEFWAEAESVRDIFETLAREVPVGETWERQDMMSDEGRSSIEKNWKAMSKIVIHRPTLKMIHEMATEPFVDEAEISSDIVMNAAIETGGNAAISLIDEIDLQWADPGQAPVPGLGASLDSVTDLDAFPGQAYFHL